MAALVVQIVGIEFAVCYLVHTLLVYRRMLQVLLLNSCFLYKGFYSQELVGTFIERDSQASIRSDGCYAG